MFAAQIMREGFEEEAGALGVPFEDRVPDRD